MGYIRRETDPEDRRQYNLFLTDKGKELAPVISGLLGEWSRIMSTDMSDEDRHTAMKLLDKMLENGKSFFTDPSQASS
jgi:DNA-binding MarR family transcriptional regulator